MTHGASFPEYTKNSENTLNVIKKKNGRIQSVELTVVG